MQTREDIQIADIEVELSRLGEIQKAGNQIRACLFNLIIYTHEKRNIKYLQKLVHTIVTKFPCRILFIQVDTLPDQNYLKVNVSNEIVGTGSNRIACDQIFIEASLSQFHRIPFILLPHFVPDLPIYLIWGQDPTQENAIFPQLQRLATRVIFDSVYTSDLQKFSLKMLELVDMRSHYELVDMQWVLTHGWRYVISQIFDSQNIKQLQNCRELHITYNQKEADSWLNNQTQAMYLLAWLSSSLQWKNFTKQNQNQYQCIHENRDCLITLIPEAHPDLPSGTIVGVTVISHDNCSFIVSPLKNYAKVVVHISSPMACELPCTLALASFKKNFPHIEELFFSPTLPAYRKMLELLAQIFV